MERLRTPLRIDTSISMITAALAGGPSSTAALVCDTDRSGSRVCDFVRDCPEILRAINRGTGADSNTKCFIISVRGFLGQPSLADGNTIASFQPTTAGAFPADTFSAFTEKTGDYMQRLRMNVIFLLNHPTGGYQPLSDAAAADYVSGMNGLLGMLGDWTGNNQITTPSGLPIIGEIQMNNLAQEQTALNNAAAKWNGTTPVFVALSAIAWNLTPSNIQNLAASLGPQYEVVRADVFFNLLRQTLGTS